MAIATLSRIPVAHWNILACLRRSSDHGNAGILRSYLDIQLSDLVELAEQELITAYAGRNERPINLAEATFLPGITVRLTAKGKTLATEVVRVASLLLWLSRRGRAGATLRQISEVAVFDLPQLRELDELAFVEAFLPDSDGRRVPMRDVTAMGDMVRLRITALGKRYTTEGER